MTPNETVRVHRAVRLSARERRARKKATARYIRRVVRRDPETAIGRDARSRIRGWAD